MQKVAVIGAGISGLSSALFLKDRFAPTIFEKEGRPGGLVRCDRVNGNLFHTCGGHVFNSRYPEILNWFWSEFNREDEFVKSDRNSAIILDGIQTDGKYEILPYPIENHVYMLNKEIRDNFFDDLNEIDRVKGLSAGFSDYDSFGDFLYWRFGKTLYDLYFQPYNEKVWRRDLTGVPMSWMEGKLPMPTTREMRENNAHHIEEKEFVHSTFWYEKTGGSQFIVDRLASGLDVRYNSRVGRIELRDRKWIVCGETFDKVVFCGNIKDMIGMVYGVNIDSYISPVESLSYHGTTSVFCEIDKNPYSWIYLPSLQYECHRIICTGNFASSNNDPSLISKGRISATVEFTDEIGVDDIVRNLKYVPFNPRYITHKYNKYTYPIQDALTRGMIRSLKNLLAPYGFYFTGRFADWEYYNMDVAMAAAKDVCSILCACL